MIRNEILILAILVMVLGCTVVHTVAPPCSCTTVGPFGPTGNSYRGIFYFSGTSGGCAYNDPAYINNPNIGIGTGTGNVTTGAVITTTGTSGTTNYASNCASHCGDSNANDPCFTCCVCCCGGNTPAPPFGANGTCPPPPPTTTSTTTTTTTKTTTTTTTTTTKTTTTTTTTVVPCVCAGTVYPGAYSVANANGISNAALGTYISNYLSDITGAGSVAYIGFGYGGDCFHGVFPNLGTYNGIAGISPNGGGANFYGSCGAFCGSNIYCNNCCKCCCGGNTPNFTAFANYGNCQAGFVG